MATYWRGAWRIAAIVIISVVGLTCMICVASYAVFFFMFVWAIAPHGDPFQGVRHAEQIILADRAELENITQLFADYPTLYILVDGGLQFDNGTGHLEWVSLAQVFGRDDRGIPECVPSDICEAEPRFYEAFQFLARINAHRAAIWDARITVHLNTYTHTVVGGSLISIESIPNGRVWHHGRAAKSMTPQEWSPTANGYRWMQIADDWYVVLEYDD